MYFKKFWYQKLSCIIRSITVSSNISVSQCWKISWGTLQSFRKFVVLKNSMHRIRISLLSLEFFRLTVPRRFVGEPFNVSESSVHWKILCMRMGYHYLPLKVFLSHSTKKIRRGILLCVRKLLVSKLLMHKRGISRFFVVLLKFKIVGQGWDWSPYLALLNPVALFTVPCEQLQIPTNISELIKVWHDRDSNPNVPLQNLVVLTPLLSFIFGKKDLAILDGKERHYWVNNFYICGAKSKCEMLN